MIRPWLLRRDDGARKWAALLSWAQSFEKAYYKQPTVWLGTPPTIDTSAVISFRSRGL
jgi:hypothetical protein